MWNYFFLYEIAKKIMMSCRPLNAKIHVISVFSRYYEYGKNDKILKKKNGLVLDFISAQPGQFTTIDCTHLPWRGASKDSIHF